MANDLSSLLNELVMQTGGASASSVSANFQGMNENKTTLKNQMAGLANTKTGIDILKQIVNNTTVDIVERTAAAETLNPGTLINFNEDGTIAVNAPSSTTSFDPALPYTAPAGDLEAGKVQTQFNTSKRAATVQDLLVGINNRFTQISAETNPAVISESMATLNQSIADFQYARQEELKLQSRSLFGLDALEQQMATDKQLDMQAAQEMYGVDYTGMSSESQYTYSEYQMAVGRANEWLERQNKTDPTLAAVAKKAADLDSFASGRFKALGESNQMADIAALISTSTLDSTFNALGIDPVSATPEQRRQVSLEIQSGNQFYNKAQIIGLNTSQVPVYLSAGGPEAEMAKNVLLAEAGGNSALVNEMVAAYTDFEKFAGENNIASTELEGRGLAVPTDLAKSAMQGNNARSREEQAQSVQFARWKFIKDTFNARATQQIHAMSEFDLPQSDHLVDMDGVVKGLLSVREQYPDMGPVTLGQTIKAMSWPTDTLEAEKKEEALIDYIYHEAKKRGNTAIGMPSEFGNRELIKTFVQRNRIDGRFEFNEAVKMPIPAWMNSGGLFGDLNKAIKTGKLVRHGEE